MKERAVVQAVTSQLSTAAVQVRAQELSGLRSVVATAAPEQVFSEYFSFPANHTFQ
jgi:hypothetical protein